MQNNDFNRNMIVIVLLSGSFISILNQTLMITAIPPIMGEMRITANTAQWLTTVFMLVNGIMIPISAFLLMRFTTRQLFITAMSVFAAGTLVAGVAPNFPMILVGRVIQSAGAGVMLPLMQTVFLMIFPVHRRGAAMGLIGLVISFAPAIGPALSGWVLEHYSWRVLFFIILPIAIIDIVAAFFALRNVTELTKPRLDVLSIILSSFGFGGLLYGFTSAGNNGWFALMTILSLAIGAVSLAAFIFRQLQLEQPMLEFRVFNFPIFPLGVAIGMIGFMGLIGFETLIPLYMQNMRGFTPFEAGLALLPGALITGLMSPITGRIFDRFGARKLVMTGLVIMTASSIAFIRLDTSTTFTFITVMYGVRMFGLSMVMMPVATAGLNQLPTRFLPHGAAMDNTMRQVAASIGTAILVTVMTTSETRMTAKGMAHADIYGANIAFIVVAILSFAGLVISFFVKDLQPRKEEQNSGAE